MLLVYLVLVFKYDRAWNHPFTVEPKTGPSLEVKSGSFDRYGQKELDNLLPNKDNPAIIKPEKSNSGTKTVKNKGYEGWKLKNKESSGAQVINDSEFQALKRRSSISDPNTAAFPPLPLSGKYLIS